MTIQLEIGPEMEAELVSTATSKGVAVPEYVKQAIERSLLQEVRPRQPKTKEEIQAFLDAMAYHGPISEEMKTQRITREFIYEGHD